MRIGPTPRSTLVAGLCFTSAIVALAGCDRGAAQPPRPPAAASATPQAASARYTTDERRNRVWQLTPDGAYVYDGASERRFVALPGWQWVGPPYGCLPDIALAPDGAALVTSNIVPTLWRIDPATFAVSVHPIALDADTAKDIGFSALVYAPKEGEYFAVSDVQRSLWRIDAKLERGSKLALSSPLPRACGLTMRNLLPVADGGKHTRLCVSSGDGESRVVSIATRARSADVREAPCADSDR